MYADDLVNDLPDGWSVRPFEELVYFQEGPGIRNWQYVDEGVPFVNIRCLVDGRLARQAMSHVSKDEALGKYSHFLLDVDDYVVSSSGTLGRIATVQKSDLPCMLNTSVIRMRPKTEELDRGYLKYFLLSEYYQAQILSFATGSAQLNYGPMHLRQMFIVCPPLPEQRTIANILGTLDEKIELNRRMNETLEEMARALFKSWFVDFDPVRAKAMGRNAGLPGKIAELFPESFEESEEGLIPAGWKLSPLREVSAYLGRGLSPRYVDSGGICVLNQRCVRNRRVDFSKARRHDQSAKSTDGRLLLPLDLLVNSTGVGTLGRVAQIWDLLEPAIADSHMTVVRAAAGVDPYFLGVNLAGREAEIEALGEGSTGQTELSRARLGALNCLMPPEGLQALFGRSAGPLFVRACTNEKNSHALATLRDALLPKLVNGEIRSGDAWESDRGRV